MREQLKPRVAEDACSEDNTGPRLSISSQDSHIINIPYSILCTIFQDAAKLVKSGNDICPLPGNDNQGKYNISNERGTAHTVSISTSGRSPTIKCSKDCACFSAFKMCSHSLALAKHLDVLSAYVMGYRAKKFGINATKMANANMPTGRGRKAVHATKRRKGKANRARVEPKDYAPFQPAPPTPTPGAYELHLIQFCREKTSVCFGCRGQLKPTAGGLAKPPHELVIVTKTRRRYMRGGQQHVQPDPTNVYFHANESCVKLHNQFFLPALLVIADDVKPHLDHSHRELRMLAAMQVKL